MGRNCTVCVSASAGAVNEALRAGRPAAALAAEFGLGERAVLRHATAHLARYTDPPADATDGSDPIAELVATLRRKALAGDPAIVREYRLALAAQTAARNGAAPPADLSATPEWAKLRGAVLAALEPFPEARQAVAEAVDR